MRDGGETFGKFAIGPFMLITMFVLGVTTWVVGKLMGSRQTFEAGIAVAAWAYVPRVLQQVLAAVQGLVMDPSKLNSAFSLSIGPARFFDPDATNPVLYQLLGRFDLFVIWSTVLLAVGLHVTGKVTKKNAAICGVLVWLVASIVPLGRAYSSM